MLAPEADQGQPAWQAVKLPAAACPPVEAPAPSSAPAVAPRQPAEPAIPATCNLARAEMRDLEALLALESRCFAKPLALSRRQLRGFLQSRTATVHVLRGDGQAVAEGLILRRRSRSRMTARLYSLAVDSAYRGRGFGRTLLMNCLDVVRAEDIPTVFLEVDVQNAPAIGLYESAGFVKTKRLADYYGPGQDGWKMRLDLPAGRPRMAVTPVAATAMREVPAAVG